MHALVFVVVRVDDGTLFSLVLVPRSDGHSTSNYFSTNVFQL